MKRAWMLALGLTATLGWNEPAAAAAPTDGARLERARFNDREYVRIKNWAEENGYTLRWLEVNRMVEFAKPSQRLVFTKDSREARINGVGVWLSWPVVYANDRFYLSEQDFRKTLIPLVAPPRQPAGRKVRTIVLDPGHGGKDPGNQTGPRQEKIYTLRLAERLKSELTKAGFRVSLTRITDRDLELEDRAGIANRRGADLFVSLHFNAAGASGQDAHGVETYCLTPAGADSTNSRGGGGDTGTCAGNRQDLFNINLAYHIQRALLRNLPMLDRGVRRARFAVLRDPQMPAVLVEGGFLTFPAEARRIADEQFRGQLARAIAEGIKNYKKAVEG